MSAEKAFILGVKTVNGEDISARCVRLRKANKQGQPPVQLIRTAPLTIWTQASFPLSYLSLVYRRSA